ncbi:MAG: hypothetical protein K2W92_02690 [Alphaproteobacteria bacterium]|nr:hypothetical protein [Alphaproteobacteria bacterium]
MNKILEEIVYPSINRDDIEEWRNPKAVIDGYYLPFIKSDMPEEFRNLYTDEYNKITNNDLEELKEYLRFAYIQDK